MAGGGLKRIDPNILLGIFGVGEYIHRKHAWQHHRWITSDTPGSVTAVKCVLLTLQGSTHHKNIRVISKTPQLQFRSKFVVIMICRSVPYHNGEDFLYYREDLLVSREDFLYYWEAFCTTGKSFCSVGKTCCATASSIVLCTMGSALFEHWISTFLMLFPGTLMGSLSSEMFETPA